MKVLWFEITIPSGYLNTNNVLGGWQDALENVVSNHSDIELYVAFLSQDHSQPLIVGNVNYIPICQKMGILNRVRNLFTWKVCERLVVNECLQIVEAVQPDIIHVFGTEFPFGLISKTINVPLVIHIQGAIIPYYNAGYPPRYNGYTMVSTLAPNLIWQFYIWVKHKKELSRVKMETDIWRSVQYYMGRTEWDKALANLQNPTSTYFHVDELLRPIFYNENLRWKYEKSDKLKIVTVGIGTFWKGPDMILKTANILCSMGVNFEWKVAGCIRKEIKKAVELKEKLTFQDNKVSILGNLQPDQLCALLVDSTLFVHTAYIDNSPNSICEAQIVGIPVVSTYVGGIDSIVSNNVDGILVPANDPWRMAYVIMKLAEDEARMNTLSSRAKENARKRHDRDKILSELLKCYKSVIEKK